MKDTEGVVGGAECSASNSGRFYLRGKNHKNKIVRGGMGPATDLDKLTPREESLFPREIENGITVLEATIRSETA
jgi:hypothetical protein